MSQALRKITGSIKSSNCQVIFINQIRMKIGVMFGSPETTSGGNALKFYASVRLDIRRTGTIKEGEVAVANEVRVKVVKNKVAPPFRQAEFQIRFGTGIDRYTELVDLGVTHGIVDKAGAWYSYNGDRIGQGKANVGKFFTNNPEMAAGIDRAVRIKAGLIDEDTVIDDQFSEASKTLQSTAPPAQTKPDDDRFSMDLLIDGPNYKPSH